MTRVELDEQGFDWIKQSWDLDGIDDIKSLVAFLKSIDMTPAHFMRLPVYKANVEKMPWIAELASITAAGEQPRPVARTIFAAAPSQDSAMIAIYPKMSEAAALAQPDGEKPEILHVTLAFLGEITAEQASAAEEAIRGVAATYPAISGTVGGLAVFAAGEDGYPSLALPDVPGLWELHAATCYALWEAGIPWAVEHGWTPHLTIAYEQEPKLPPADLLGRRISFDWLTVSRGDVRADHLLIG